MSARDATPATLTRRYYDGMTPYYRFFYSPLGLHYGLWLPRTRRLKQALLNHKQAVLDRLAPLGPGDHVLDAGCGTGATARFLHRKTGCRVTGITLSPAQLRLARRQARATAGRIGFELRDFCACAFANDAFSHVVAVESSCYAPDKAAWLREMHRVLRPGGRLVIADYYLSQQETHMDREQQREYAIFCRGFAVPGLPFLADMECWIAEAGFTLRASEDITAAVRPTAWRIRWLGLLTFPFGLLLRALRIAPPELLPHLRTCIHQPVALCRLGSYRLLTLEKPST